MHCHYFVTEMYTHEHISVTKWRVVENGTSASWDLCNRSIRIVTLFYVIIIKINIPRCIIACLNGIESIFPLLVEWPWRIWMKSIGTLPQEGNAKHFFNSGDLQCHAPPPPPTSTSTSNLQPPTPTPLTPTHRQMGCCHAPLYTNTRWQTICSFFNVQHARSKFWLITY